MDMKKYKKPEIVSVEVPERTSYACNVNGTIGCPNQSTIVGGGLCDTGQPGHNNIFGLGGPC